MPNRALVWQEHEIDRKGACVHPQSGSRLVTENSAQVSPMWPFVIALVLIASTASAESGFDEKYERDYNIFNPINQYRPDNPLNPANAVDPTNPFNPINSVDPGNPANSINQYNPNNPFNPINQYNPDNPLNSINRFNPETPFRPLTVPSTRR